MRQQRSGLPLMIIAFILFVLAALAALIWFDPFGLELFGLSADRPAPQVPVAEAEADEEPEPQPEPAADPQPQPEPQPEPEPEQQSAPTDESPRPTPAANITPQRRYVVQRGDTLNDLSQTYWGDPNLWPLIYQANEEAVVDPDFLTPGQELTIPEWLESGTPVEGQWLRTLSEAHVSAHQLYASLGDDAIGLGAGQPRWWLDRLGRERANKALWVLYSGLRYNQRLLDQYAGQIDPQAVSQVRAYVERFGYPPRG